MGKRALAAVTLFMVYGLTRSGLPQRGPVSYFPFSGGYNGRYNYETGEAGIVNQHGDGLVSTRLCPGAKQVASFSDGNSHKILVACRSGTIDRIGVSISP